ncbi:MAG: DUF5829 family protein, partial [Planctomycetota bacterium]
GSEIWDDLYAVRQAWRDARPTEVFFNHLYFAPDAQTYDALRRAALFANGFAPHEERTTTRPDMTYTGFYIYGADTYFEFLKPEGSVAKGGTGVALGIEALGGTGRLAKSLEAVGVRSFAGPTSRELDGSPVPWFQALGVERAHPMSSLQLFSLEYEESFLDRWHAELAPRPSGIARRQVLERYAAQLGQSDLRADGLLDNVTEVSLTLDAKEMDRFRRVASACGFIQGPDGSGLTWLGPQIRYVLEASARPGGVTGFRAKLRRSVERQELRFGRATLLLDGDSATFRMRR